MNGLRYPLFLGYSPQYPLFPIQLDGTSYRQWWLLRQAAPVVLAVGTAVQVLVAVVPVGTGGGSASGLLLLVLLSTFPEAVIR